MLSKDLKFKDLGLLIIDEEQRFGVKDKERLTNRMMMQIADEYIRRMGYGDTQALIVRHNDREHPHLHLVLNRVDGNGKCITDKNERVRNAKVCRV